MRNKLTSNPPAAGSLSGLIYSASGELERHYTAVNAYRNGDLCLTFGPMRINLGIEAAAELARHIGLAVEAVSARE